MKKFGMILKILGYISYSVFGMWGFFVEIAFIYSAWGILGTLIGIILVPVVLPLLPFYILLVYGNWNLILIIYGGGILGLTFYLIGSWLAKEE